MGLELKFLLLESSNPVACNPRRYRLNWFWLDRLVEQVVWLREHIERNQQFLLQQKMLSERALQVSKLGEMHATGVPA
jgi:hypothetical protein